MKLRYFFSGVVSLALLASSLALPARAAGGAIDLVDGGGTLTGSTISGFDENATLRLAVMTESGSLTWNDEGNSGVSIVSNGSQQRAAIWLEGTQAQLNAAFAEISHAKPCAGNYKVYAQVSTDQSVKNPQNGHVYRRSASSQPYAAAVATATSTPLVQGGTNTFGYIATLTSAFEMSLVANLLTGDDWLGATDVAVEGDWTWDGGPEAGTVFYRGRGDLDGAAVNNAYHNWAGNEPNDYGDGEDFAQLYSDGKWNDIGDGEHTYTIEFGGMPGDNLAQSTIVSDSFDVSIDGLFSGQGTSASPFIVDSVEKLAGVTECRASNFYFKQTVDLSLPTTWDGSKYFSGQYDGNGNTISYQPGLVVSQANFGVWGNSSNESSVSNLTVTGDIVANGYNNVGLLFGNGQAKLSDITASGSISTSDYAYGLGGVAGEYGGKLIGVNSTVNIFSTSDGDAIGGVVGYYWGSMTNASWDGTINVSGTGESYGIGGLVGEASCGFISSSKAEGTITVSNSGFSLGGLVGNICGDVRFSKANVTVVASQGVRVGGVAGRIEGSMYKSAAYGDVSGSDYVGGLAGYAVWNTFEDVYARGDVVSASMGGSLIGYVTNHTISRAYATGTVTAGTSRGLYGGLQGSALNYTHWIPSQSTVTEPNPLENGEVPFTDAELKSLDYYDNEGWSISSSWEDSTVWIICSRVEGGYPVLTALYTEDPCSLPQTLTPTPVITGTGVEGSALTGNPGTWDSGVTLTFAWLRDGIVIANETGSSYVPVAADVAKTITFRVTSTKADYRPVVKTSLGKLVSAKPAVVVVPPKLAGSPEVKLGGFGANAWWIPKGFVSGIKAAVKARSKATTLTCIGIVGTSGNKEWQKKLGLKRAELACAIAKSFNSKLKTTLTWKVAAKNDKIQRGATLRFNR